MEQYHFHLVHWFPALYATVFCHSMQLSTHIVFSTPRAVDACGCDGGCCFVRVQGLSTYLTIKINIAGSCFYPPSLVCNGCRHVAADVTWSPRWIFSSIRKFPRKGGLFCELIQETIEQSPKSCFCNRLFDFQLKMFINDVP